MSNPNKEYTIRLMTLFDSSQDVTFKVEPPIRFVSDEARIAMGQNVIRLIGRRADPSELCGAVVEFTHDSADGSGTLGYARVEALRYGSGEEVFRQAVLVALNGTYPDLYGEDSIHAIRHE